MKAIVFLFVAILAVAANAQSYPEQPSTCDPNTCAGCGPYLPKPTKADNMPCGINDIYFPVPVSVIKNDTSVSNALNPSQWLCVPCCSQSCGFDNSGATCKVNFYTYSATPGDYGCTKCVGGLTKNPQGGSTKTYFSNLSTNTVYEVQNTYWTSCSAAPPSPPTPSPSPSIVPSPVPSSSPSSTSPSPMAPTPAAALPPPPTPVVAPVPAPVPAPAPAPIHSPPPPQVIIVTAPPPSSAIKAASSVMMSAVFATTFLLLLF